MYWQHRRDALMAIAKGMTASLRVYGTLVSVRTPNLKTRLVRLEPSTA